MRKCNKCGRYIYSSYPYCPDCGALMPDAEERKFVYPSALKNSNTVPAGMVEYDKKLYENAMQFYNAHLSSGYAPKGMRIIDKKEYSKLKDIEGLFEYNKRRLGVQKILTGGGAYETIPNYEIKTINSTEEVDFEKLLKEIKPKNKFLRIIASIIPAILSFSFIALIGISTHLLMGQNSPFIESTDPSILSIFINVVLLLLCFGPTFILGLIFFLIIASFIIDD